MADQTLAALRELTEAVMAEFFLNDSNLSKRLIKATNEAQLVLMVQPPDDDRVNHPAPAESVELTDEELLRFTALAQIYRFQSTAGDPVQYEPTEGQLLAAFRAAIAADRARRPAPAEPADHIPGPAKMVSPPAEGEAGELAEWLRRRGCSHPLGNQARLFYRAAELLQQHGGASQAADWLDGVGYG